jgi:hypothetical protein
MKRPERLMWVETRRTSDKLQNIETCDDMDGDNVLGTRTLRPLKGMAVVYF